MLPRTRGERLQNRGGCTLGTKEKPRRRAPPLPQSHEFLSKERASMRGEKKNVPSQQIPPQARAAQGPFVQCRCQPPTAAPSPSSALPRHPRLHRCLKDAIMVCAPKEPTAGLVRSHAWRWHVPTPILAPTANSSPVHGTDTAWRMQGHCAAGTEGPQQVGAVLQPWDEQCPAGAGRAPAWYGHQSGFLPILPLSISGSGRAQPLTPQRWQARPAAELHSGTGHGGAMQMLGAGPGGL